MGMYINPRRGSKEQWLDENAVPVQPENYGSTRQEQYAALCKDGFLPVCLVDNGPFTAAGIAYSQGEYEAFSYEDPRPRKWFIAPAALLQEFMR